MRSGCEGEIWCGDGLGEDVEDILRGIRFA